MRQNVISWADYTPDSHAFHDKKQRVAVYSNFA